MRKSYIIIIVVIGLVACLIGGFFIYKNFSDREYDEIWVDESGNEDFIEYIYNDVPRDYWASEYILYVVQRDIMSVDEENNFYPEENMTMRDFLTVLLKALMPRVDVSKFSDEEFIAFLQDEKILSKDFKMEEMYSSLTNYYATLFTAKADIHVRDYEQEITDLKYIDLDEIDDVGQTLIGHAISRGFVKTKTTKKFYPQKVLTRAEIAEILYLFLND